MIVALTNKATGNVELTTSNKRSDYKIYLHDTQVITIACVLLFNVRGNIPNNLVCALQFCSSDVFQ